MVTHVGGLDSVAEATLRLTEAPAGKKLAEITKSHKGLWCEEAESYLLENWKSE